MKWYSGVWAIQEICLLMEESIFFYTPTYIMVSIMMKALLEIPEKVIRLDGFMDTLKRGMLACTGRRFMGSGYDAIAGLIDCL